MAKAPGAHDESPGAHDVALVGTLPTDISVAVGGGISGTWNALRHDRSFLLGSSLILVMVIMAIAPQLFAGWFGHGDPRNCNLLDSGRGPTSAHPFGFDMQGCDLYSNVVYGARASITIGLLFTLLTSLVGVAVGLVSGFYGGLIDAVVGRVSDIMFGFPFIIGAIVILNALQAHNILTVSAVLAFFSWPITARVMRSAVLDVRNMDYVVAARALGANSWRLMVRHILPNALAPVIVLATLGIGGIIAAEAALTFLGVGLRPPSISWGVQLNTAQVYFATKPHLLIFPSLFLGLTVLGFIVLGDAVRDALDPKHVR